MGNLNIIRRATVDDAAAIATIHVKTWQYAYQGQLPDSYLQSLSIERRTEGWKRQLENSSPNTATFVVENNLSIVGWCSIGASRDEDKTDTTGELYAIYVHPDAIGKGFGSKLMNRALDALRESGFKTATLWVLDTNQNTRTWYESKGWRADGKTKTEMLNDIELNEVRYSINLDDKPSS